MSISIILFSIALIQGSQAARTDTAYVRPLQGTIHVKQASVPRTIRAAEWIFKDDLAVNMATVVWCDPNSKAELFFPDGRVASVSDLTPKAVLDLMPKDGRRRTNYKRPKLDGSMTRGTKPEEPSKVLGPIKGDHVSANGFDIVLVGAPPEDAKWALRLERIVLGIDSLGKASWTVVKEDTSSIDPPTNGQFDALKVTKAMKPMGLLPGARYRVTVLCSGKEYGNTEVTVATEQLAKVADQIAGLGPVPEAPFEVEEYYRTTAAIRLDAECTFEALVDLRKAYDATHSNSYLLRLLFDSYHWLQFENGESWALDECRKHGWPPPDTRP